MPQATLVRRNCRPMLPRTDARAYPPIPIGVPAITRNHSGAVSNSSAGNVAVFNGLGCACSGRAGMEGLFDDFDWSQLLKDGIKSGGDALIKTGKDLIFGNGKKDTPPPGGGGTQLIAPPPGITNPPPAVVVVPNPTNQWFPHYVFWRQRAEPGWTWNPALEPPNAPNVGAHTYWYLQYVKYHKMVDPAWPLPTGYKPNAAALAMGAPNPATPSIAPKAAPAASAAAAASSGKLFGLPMPAVLIGGAVLAWLVLK